MGHVEKKGSILRVIFFKVVQFYDLCFQKGSILWVLFSKVVSSLSHIFKVFNSLSHIFKAFNSLSHIFKKRWILWVIFSKSVQFFESYFFEKKFYFFESFYKQFWELYEKGSILWVIVKKSIPRVIFKEQNLWVIFKKEVQFFESNSKKFYSLSRLFQKVEFLKVIFIKIKKDQVFESYWKKSTILWVVFCNEKFQFFESFFVTKKFQFCESYSKNVQFFESC